MILIIIILSLSQALSCPSKEQAFQCVQRTLDTNNDNQLSFEELNKVYDYLWWWQKVPFKAFGGVEKIVEDCDGNGDGILTSDDYISMSSCLDSCFKIEQLYAVLKC